MGKIFAHKNDQESIHFRFALRDCHGDVVEDVVTFVVLWVVFFYYIILLA